MGDKENWEPDPIDGCATCVLTNRKSQIELFRPALVSRRLAEVTPVHPRVDEAPLTVCDAVLGVLVILFLLVAWRFYSAFHEAQVRPYRCHESKRLRRRSDTMMKIGVKSDP